METAIGTVDIGHRSWTSENLRVSCFRNGDPIVEVQDEEEWRRAGMSRTPAWCYYKNKPKFGDKYGKLYNWHAIIDPRGLTPDGFRFPFYDDFTSLLHDVGNEGRVFYPKRAYLNLNPGAFSSNFNSLCGGWRLGDGRFQKEGKAAYYWSHQEKSADLAWHLGVFDKGANVYLNDKAVGMSVRCVRDRARSPNV